ncbi:MAG: hypothetical protein CFE39_10675 [Comamonadaceae bacterium PBBC2]|nr:MAG: hypothetical protein CFE39_10675 [Comamonadaceae bacterium PBBC2]
MENKLSIVGFQMWGPFRQSLMDEHRFYIEQARTRLLSQFANIEAEADRATEEHLANKSIHFNPDRSDPSADYEEAYDKGIEFYQLLSDMRDNTQLSVIAGMFHQWDKRLRDWIIREMRHWHHGKNAADAIWKADVPAILDFLGAFGFNVKAFPFYGRLDAMRLVVNVFKHGNGPSFDELRTSFPEFILNPLGAEDNCQFLLQYLDHTNIKGSAAELDQFSQAILNFWKAIPEQIFLPDDEVNIPPWFAKALSKDSLRRNSSNDK